MGVKEGKRFLESLDDMCSNRLNLDRYLCFSRWPIAGFSDSVCQHSLPIRWRTTAPSGNLKYGYRAYKYMKSRRFSCALLDFGFSQRCWWRFKSNGMWWYVHWWMVTNILKECSFSILGVCIAQEEWTFQTLVSASPNKYL